jgi:mycothiol synthase
LLKIRPFRKGSDEEAYIRIFNAAFGDYDDIRSMTLEEMKKTQEAPSYSSEGLFIAEWDGETAGMVDAYVDKFREDKKGFIQSLGVLSQFRRRGIGKCLVRAALESLKERGMKVADAWTQSDRAGCVHIFQSMGFKQVRFTSMMRRSLKDVPSAIGENRQVVTRKVDVQDEQDVRALNRLDNEAFKEHFNFRPRTLEETKYTLFEMPWFQRQRWLFAEIEGEPAGYVGVGVDEGLNKEKSLAWGWILDIGVLKPYRREGMGTRLMLEGMRSLRDIEMEDALLYVDDMNPTKAIELYEKVGFKVAKKSIIYQLKLA